MSRKHVLWISHFVPYPPKGGAFQRSYNLLREVAGQCDVSLFAIAHKPQTHPGVTMEDAANALGEFCKEVSVVHLPAVQSKASLAVAAAQWVPRGRSLTVGMYEHPAIRRALMEFVQGREFDVLHLDCISVMPLEAVVPGKPLVVLNHHNAEGSMMERRIDHEPNALKRAFFRLEAKAIKREEAQYCPRADINAVCSDLDAASLRQLAPASRYELVPNGVDVGTFTIERTPSSTPTIVFAGRLDQYANREGMLWFVNEVWPLLKEAVPDVRFDVIGHNPPAQLCSLAENDPGLEVHGFVDDVRPFFARAHAAITPIRDGGGTRLKVLDAMALGMPIVATSVAIEGLEVTDGDDLLVADAPQAYSEAIGRVLADSELAAALACQARETIERRYSWQRIGADYLALLDQAVNG